MRGTATTCSRSPLGHDAVMRKPHGISFLWPLGAITAVLYLSLLPLNLNLAAITTSTTLGLARLAFHTPTLEDFVTNLAVYVPIGFFLAAYGLGISASRFRCAVIAVIIGAGMSLTVEALQTGITERVASWWDVILNTAGATCGATLSFVWYDRANTVLDRWNRAPLDQKLRRSAMLLTVGLFAYHLAPFDFVTNTSALHDAFRRVQLSLTHNRPLNPTQPALAPLAHELSGALWFAILSLVVALGLKDRGARPGTALASAILHGIAAAGTIEVLQLFTLSHVFDLASFMLRAFGAASGAWAGVFLFTNLGVSQRPWPAPKGMYRVALGVALATQAALLCANLDWSFLNQQTGESVTAAVLPLESLWRAPMHRAVTDMAATMITYGFLAMTLALVLQQSKQSHAMPLACLGASSVSLLVALLSSISPTAPLDITKPLLATVAAFAAVEVLRSIQLQSATAPRS